MMMNLRTIPDFRECLKIPKNITIRKLEPSESDQMIVKIINKLSYEGGYFSP